MSAEKSSTDSGEKSPDVSPGGTPKRKKYKKRRIAHEAAENIAPALKEKLRTIQEREKKKVVCTTEGASQVSSENRSQVKLDILSVNATANKTLDQSLTKSNSAAKLNWAEDKEERTDQDMEEEPAQDEDIFYGDLY